MKIYSYCDNEGNGYGKYYDLKTAVKGYDTFIDYLRSQNIKIKDENILRYQERDKWYDVIVFTNKPYNSYDKSKDYIKVRSDIKVDIDREIYKLKEVYKCVNGVVGYMIDFTPILIHSEMCCVENITNILSSSLGIDFNIGVLRKLFKLFHKYEGDLKLSFVSVVDTSTIDVNYSCAKLIKFKRFIYEVVELFLYKE